jgi:hypothetical protein
METAEKLPNGTPNLPVVGIKPQALG